MPFRLSSPAGLSVLALAILLGGGRLMAQTAAGRAADEKAVRQAGKDYLAALEKGDAKALAEFWTAEGTYTDETGRSTKVRELLANNGAAHSAPRPETAVSNVSVRFVAADVAVEEGDCKLPAANGAAPVAGNFTAMWVRQGGRWRLESLHESRAEAADQGDRLAVLELLAGEWSGQMNKSTVKISAQWNATKKFLRRELSVVTDGEQSFGGTQEIGWDPLSGQIKSWNFNDDGSHGEGLWSQEGSVWMVASSWVFPDGKTASSTQIYKFRDKDTLVWKSIRSGADGPQAPDVEVVLKRSSAGE